MSLAYPCSGWSVNWPARAYQPGYDSPDPGCLLAGSEVVLAAFLAPNLPHPRACDENHNPLTTQTGTFHTELLQTIQGR